MFPRQLPRILVSVLALAVMSLAVAGCLGGRKGGGRSSEPVQSQPAQFIRQAAPVRKIPNYSFPFIGTYDMAFERTYPNVRRWIIDESLIRNRLARTEEDTLPDLNFRITERVHDPDAMLAPMDDDMMMGEPVMEEDMTTDDMLDEGMVEAPVMDMEPVEEKPYHQMIEMERQVLPGELRNMEFTYLVFRLEKPGDVVIDVNGQDIEVAVHKEGFSGAMLVNDDSRDNLKTFEFSGETGIYSLRITLKSTLSTRFTTRVTWFPYELPPVPTPTPMMDEFEDDMMEDEMMDEDMMEEDTEGEEMPEEEPAEGEM